MVLSGGRGRLGATVSIALAISLFQKLVKAMTESSSTEVGKPPSADRKTQDPSGTRVDHLNGSTINAEKGGSSKSKLLSDNDIWMTKASTPPPPNHLLNQYKIQYVSS